MDRPDSSHKRRSRLRDRLSFGLGDKIRSAFSRGGAEVDWDELEEILLSADLGPAATDAVLDALRAAVKKDKDADARDVLRRVVADLFRDGPDRALRLPEPGSSETATVVVVGVNGVGKTTSVGKLGRMLVGDGYGVVMAAADTFRAAAADQLTTWGARVGVEVVRSDREGGDPAAVAYEAGERAIATGADVVLVDTAGRLQNKRGLMDELGKILRVIARHGEPAEVLLVLDATTGQNGLEQARVFTEVAGVTGVILAKLDGSAKGGIVIAIERALGIPVKLVGLGEGADDLAPFDPDAFAEGLVG